MATPHATQTVAIVGGGAIGAALFKILVEKLASDGSLARTRVVVFEKSERVGPGLAYAKDASPYMLNQSAQTMSLVPGHRSHFCEWLQARGGSTRCNGDELFCERRIFGDYVEDQFARAVDDARRAGIAVETIRDEVSALVPRRCGGYRVVTKSHAPVEADVAVLAVGNVPSTKLRHLEAHANFVASPYPGEPMCSRIPRDARVAVLGTGLSAIDAALALFASGHTTQLTMASRSGLLPAVRGPLPPIELRHVTRANVALATDQGRRVLAWADVLKWLRAELEQHDLSLSCDRDFPSWMEPTAHLRSQLAAAKHGPRVWQSIGEALNPMIEIVWHHLGAADKKLFLDRFYSRFMSHWVPIPITNAERVLALLEAKKLGVERGLSDVTYDAAAKSFRLHFSDGRTTACDFVVNATGVPRYLAEYDSPLLQSLQQQGTIAANEFGGLDVDFESLRVLGKNGQSDSSLFALGNLTSGTHLFTSTLELNVEKAERIAAQIVSELFRRSTKDHSAHVDAAPHST